MYHFHRTVNANPTFCVSRRCEEIALL
jgi:hypothetical protein